jgi:hypothetical protein
VVEDKVGGEASAARGYDVTVLFCCTSGAARPLFLPFRRFALELSLLFLRRLL